MSKKILIVDDSATVRQQVRMALEQAGFAVTEAVDGVDAVQKVTGGFNGVVCDVNMPRMDGLTLVRQLRGTDRFKRTPILMLTTESSDEMKQAGRAAGATGWMVKPFDPARLIEVIGKVLPR